MNTDVLTFWMGISGVAAIIVLFALIYRLFFRKLFRKYYNRFFDANLVFICAFLLISIWSLRYSVGYYLSHHPMESMKDAPRLTWVEEIFNSFLHTLQTFSMDEDYTAYLQAGKEMIGQIEFTGIFAFLAPVIRHFDVYFAFLNALAPVVGGVLIFQMIAKIFPHVWLSISRWLFFWKERIYFSELNADAVALIRSIRKHRKWYNMPQIIVTDAYVDKESEKSSELANEARRLGAILVPNDLAHITKVRYNRKYVLIDENEANNLHTLTMLATKENYRSLIDAEVFIFSENDIYAEVERGVADCLMKEFWVEEDHLPSILPIQCYRNLIWNMLSDLPLFEPLVERRGAMNKQQDSSASAQSTQNEQSAEQGSENASSAVSAVWSGKKATDLYVTIIGAGRIGTEMFLSTYWCGQLMNCQLHITVISQEKAKEFEKKINYINPEILCSLRTEKTVENQKPEFLRIHPEKPDYADYYGHFRYIEYNVSLDNMTELLEKTIDAENGVKVKNTDYFLVSLGSDEENIAVAKKLREQVGALHLKNQQSEKCIITYVVYDSAVSRCLNRDCVGDYSQKPGIDIYMRAVGSLDEMYSVQNVFMNDLSLLADKLHSDYNSRAMRDDRRKKSKKRYDDEYSYYSNIARAAHVKYKIFSVVQWESSVFQTEGKEYLESIQRYAHTFSEMFRNTDRNKHQAYLLAWLEHRRWNAYMRTIGFVGIDAKHIENYYKELHSHKCTRLKLHPCIVECCETYDAQKEDRLDIVTRTVASLYARFTQEDPSLIKPVDENEQKRRAKAAGKAAKKKRRSYRLQCICRRVLFFQNRPMPEEPSAPVKPVYLENPYDFKVYDYPADDIKNYIAKNEK